MDMKKLVMIGVLICILLLQQSAFGNIVADCGDKGILSDDGKSCLVKIDDIVLICQDFFNMKTGERFYGILNETTEMCYYENLTKKDYQDGIVGSYDFFIDYYIPTYTEKTYMQQQLCDFNENPALYDEFCGKYGKLKPKLQPFAFIIHKLKFLI